MTNKQALREAAQKAIGAHERLSVMPADDIFDISLHEGTQLDADITALNAFNESANPATVLALLDELEAADVLNKHLELAIRKAEGCSEELRRKTEAAEKRIAEVRGYNVDLAEESRQYSQMVAEMNNALCELLPGVQYMDPPDGGSVTPLEQVRRMVADYREQIAELEQRQSIKHCPKCNDTGMADSGGTQPWGEPIEIKCDCRHQDDNTADLVAAGIITRIEG